MLIDLLLNVSISRHFAKPNVPNFWPSKEQRPENGLKVLHSIEYREPEVFAGHVVCIIGAGPSGIDISNDIALHAKEVTQAPGVSAGPHASFTA